MFWPFSTIYNAVLEAVALLKSLTASLAAHRAETNFKLGQIDQKVGDLMADFANLDKAIADLGAEVGEIIELLTTDSADQAKVDEAVAKLTAMKDSLDAFTPPAQ